MVFSFALPTTSHLSFQAYLWSPTHPSLPQAASTARHALRLALKHHKRLSGAEQASHLPAVQSALDNYIPYLATISRGLGGRCVTPQQAFGAAGEEEVELVLRNDGVEIEVEWRATLSSISPSLRSLRRNGRGGRVRGRGIDFEIAFTLSTLGYVLAGLARIGVLNTLYAPTTPSPEQRTQALQAAMKLLLQASAAHTYVGTTPAFVSLTAVPAGPRAARSPMGRKNSDISPEAAAFTPLPYVTEPPKTGDPVPDVDPATQSALATLALAEATLLAVLKDDSYVVACIRERNPRDKEWMIKAPEIGQVRVLLQARLCVRGAEYAEQTAAGLGAVGAAGNGARIHEDLINYTRVLGRVARARACRFFGIDAEMSGKVGDGIAYLRAGKGVLGIKASLAGDEGPKKKGGLARLKQGWSERREEKKLDKDAGGGKSAQEGELEWGDDAGRDEEGRVINMLETKWVKMNDTMNTQIIPPSTSLLSSLPSGRDVLPPPAAYTPPVLDADELARMHAPPQDDFPGPDELADSSDEDPVLGGEPPGAFPSRSWSRAESEGTAYY